MKPLSDVTVIELSTMITASLAAMMMAEQGARVIKVEPIDAGDPLRYIGATKGGISGIFANCNRGKHSIRIDIKSEEGQALIEQLAGKADVLIHNFRPGVMDKLNLGSELLRGLNPQLIYMAISGFGNQGPMSSAPAYDPVIQAQCGMAASQGREEPMFIHNLMCDKITGYTACQAVTSALYLREKTGEGQHIDLSMLDSGMYFMFPDAYMNHTLLDDDVAPQPLLADLLYQMTITKDGGITVSAATQKQRDGVVKALGREDLAEDPRFNSLENLLANFEAYRAILREDFAALETDEAIRRLQANDVPCAKCLSLDEALAQPQVVANQSLELQAHPAMGQIRTLRNPPRFGGELTPVPTASPGHGEHTDAVLESVGISEEQRLVLRESKVIA
jgi:crotonobetainyl-CoA:carnitine CoA-transferase CaiB-like acyl-CoA transferase